MAEKQTYKVLRQMDGDKMYYPGDTRDLTEADAKHLVALGALEPVAGKSAKAAKTEAAQTEEPADAPVEWEHHEIAKAEEAPLNKAEAAAPAKKGRRG